MGPEGRFQMVSGGGKGVRLVPGEGESKGMQQGLEKGGRALHTAAIGLRGGSGPFREQKEGMTGRHSRHRVCLVKSRALTYACQKRPAVSEDGALAFLACLELREVGGHLNP